MDKNNDRVADMAEKQLKQAFATYLLETFGSDAVRVMHVSTKQNLFEAFDAGAGFGVEQASEVLHQMMQDEIQKEP